MGTGRRQPESSTRAGWIAHFAGKSVAANLILLQILASGLLSGSRIVVRGWPKFDSRTVAVTARVPGWLLVDVGLAS